VDDTGRLTHFLTIEGLGREQLIGILDTAKKFVPSPGDSLNKSSALLAGHTVVNLFFEDSTRTRTTAHTGCDKDHVAALDVVHDFVHGFHGSGTTDFRTGTSTKALCQVRTQLNGPVRHGQAQGLGISIGNDIFDAFEMRADHVVHSVAAGTTNTDNGDPWLEFSSFRHSQI